MTITRCVGSCSEHLNKVLVVSLILLVTNKDERRKVFKLAINQLGQGSQTLKVISDIEDLVTQIRKGTTSPICIDWNLGERAVSQIVDTIASKSPICLPNIIVFTDQVSKDALYFSINQKIYQTIYSTQIETLCRALTKTINISDTQRTIELNVRSFYNMIRKGNCKEAVSKLIQLRQKQPVDEYRLALASAYFYLGDFERSNELLYEQIRRKPNLRAYDLQIRICLKRKEVKEAKEILNAAPEFKASNSEHLLNLATLYIGAHKPQEVMEELFSKNIIGPEQVAKTKSNQIIQIDTFNILVKFFQSGINDIDRASIFNALALLANKKERYDKALEYYIFAYIFTGGNQTLSEKIIHNIAIAQYRLKKVDRAISCYEFLLEKNPNDEKASRKLGGISAHYQPKKTA